MSRGCCEHYYEKHKDARAEQRQRRKNRLMQTHAVDRNFQFTTGDIEDHIDIRVRFHIIRNARIENVGKYQSCMVSKVRIIWKQTVDTDEAAAISGKMTSRLSFLECQLADAAQRAAAMSAVQTESETALSELELEHASASDALHMADAERHRVTVRSVELAVEHAIELDKLRAEHEDALLSMQSRLGKAAEDEHAEAPPSVTEVRF